MAQFITTIHRDAMAVRYITRAGALAAATRALADGATTPDGMTLTDTVRALVTSGRQSGASGASDVYRLADGTVSDATDVARHRYVFGDTYARDTRSWRRYCATESRRFASGALTADDIAMIARDVAWRARTGYAVATPDAVIADVAAGRNHRDALTAHYGAATLAPAVMVPDTRASR